MDVLRYLPAFLDALHLAPGLDPCARHKLMNKGGWQFVEDFVAGQVAFAKGVDDYRFRARVAGLRLLVACAGAFFGTVMDAK